jgi:CelD/BcsL family acetyltransferase involved in cellulose biosynthesis
MAGRTLHPSGLEPVLISDPAGIAEIEDEWRRLAELRSNAFVTPEWFRSWWAHQSESSTPLIVAAHRDDGELAGLMPLVLDTSSRPHTIRFAGATLGDFFHPAASEDDESAVAAAAMTALEERNLGRHIVMLEKIDPGRWWWREMQRASSRRLACIQLQRNQLAHIPLRGWDWESYLASRSKNFRRRVRRRENALRRDHEVLVHEVSEENLDADLDRFFHLHDLRWSERGGSSLEAPGARAALRTFAAEALQRGWLRLRLLEVDGVAVASFLGWRMGDVYAFYQQGFDPAWSASSPGFVLSTLMVREAMQEGAGEFDFLLGTEAYKITFTTAARPVETIVLAKASSPTRLMVAAEATARRLGRRMAERPLVGRLARSLVRRLPTSRGA